MSMYSALHEQITFDAKFLHDIEPPCACLPVRCTCGCAKTMGKRPDVHRSPPNTRPPTVREPSTVTQPSVCSNA